MEHSSRQSEVSDTRSKPDVPRALAQSQGGGERSSDMPQKGDGFFVARLRLTFYYTLFTAVIVGGFSVILYQTLLSNFADTLRDTAPGLNPHVFSAVIDRAHIILTNRLLIADAIILFFSMVFGYLLTDRSLKPIRENMRKQRRFVADASHELRTPIAVIISGLEVALRNKDLTLDQSKQTLADTLEEMRSFSNMSNQLLDLSKYDISKAGTSGQDGRVRVRIADILHSAASKMKTLADEKSIAYVIDVRTDEDVWVLGNEVDLNRVFYNVIHNAIAYTPKHGSITVEGRISMGKYVTTVSDTGVGISAKTLGKIFEPFFRGDASRNNKEDLGDSESAADTGQMRKGTGAGLGLTLARKIVDAHQGSIVIKSKEHHGTKAVISLPLSS